MIYFRAHIQALESQIAFLKERLEKAELEKRAVEEAARRRITDVEEAARLREDALLERLTKVEEGARLRENGLLERLAKAEEGALARADALLDRVLVKNNVSPVAEPLVSAPPVEMMTPYAGMGPDMQEAYKESWIKEEAAWIMSEDSAIDEGTARVYAEQNYVTRHQLIK